MRAASILALALAVSLAPQASRAQEAPLSGPPAAPEPPSAPSEPQPDAPASPEGKRPAGPAPETPATGAPPPEPEPPPSDAAAPPTSSPAPATADAPAPAPEPAPRPSPPAAARPATSSVRHRVLLLLRQDVAWIAGDDPCTAESQATGEFSCFRNTGSQYLGTPDPSRGLAFEGFNAATTRLLAGCERFFGEQVALTGLFGVVLQGGGPTPVGSEAHAFLPIHVELDAAYWPWGAPDRAGQVRPFAVLGGGLAQIDSGFTLTVHEDPSAPPAASQLDNPSQQELEVYSKRGTGFVDAGLGVEARITGALAARARVLGLWSFPAPGTNLAFDLGFGVDL
jgi:hypothetical protein